jgi:hypothetical protein
LSRLESLNRVLPRTARRHRARLRSRAAEPDATCCEFPSPTCERGESQGVQLATTQALARYWATEYGWRKCEARLKALPQFVTEIDGLDIHFIHVRSKHENALPLIVTHGVVARKVQGRRQTRGPSTSRSSNCGAMLILRIPYCVRPERSIERSDPGSWLHSMDSAPTRPMQLYRIDGASNYNLSRCRTAPQRASRCG